MIYQSFLAGATLVLLGHAYLVAKAGLRLVAKAFLFVVGIWLFVSILGYGSIYLGLLGSPTYALIAVSVFVCIEDLTRTWFVVGRAREHALIAASSLAFAAVASLFEILVQASDLILAAGAETLGRAASGDTTFFDAFFSSYSVPLATVGIIAVRPAIHYLLCISLYYGWRMRNWPVYTALIGSHVALDVIIEFLANENHISYPVPAAGVSFFYVLLLGTATLWIRAKAKQGYGDRGLRLR